MVKLGFIVEGDTEKIILESDNFIKLLEKLRINFIPEIINTKGNGNLLPHNIEKHSQLLIDKGATKIVILTDLDEDSCITLTKERIKPLENHIVVVSVKQIESWFLADTLAMRTFFSDETYEEQNPESHLIPFVEIHRLKLEKVGSGIGKSKIKLANTLVNRVDFSIERAAEHPNCSSAKYFIDKIKQVGIGQ